MLTLHYELGDEILTSIWSWQNLW